MDTDASKPPLTTTQALMALLPVMGIVFVGYVVVGFALPVLPLHVHKGLGFSAFIVGVVVGAQFVAALVSRMWAGQHADRKSAKHAVTIGLIALVLAGAGYLVSLQFREPVASATVLLASRLLLGVGQSFIVAGALNWGLALSGPQHTGKVLAWVGIALYAANAIGAPAGAYLYERFGFTAIALASILFPAITLLLIAPMKHVGARATHPTNILGVIGAIWMPGVALSLGVVGYGAVLAFIVLRFLERGWGAAWLAFTLISLAFMAGRTFFGHLPDRIGGARVGMIFALVEAAGLALIWAAKTPVVALAGVTLTGVGYALVYPGFGVVALKRAPEQSRGLAMGAYTAFYDLSLGISAPALGIVAGLYGLDSVFLASAVVSVCSAGAALALTMQQRHCVSQA